MKVIWRNYRSIGTGRNNLGEDGNKDELKKPSSYNSLTKMKGYNHNLQADPKNETGNEKELQISLRTEDDAPHACQICRRTDRLRCIDDFTSLLKECFGVKVPDPSVMVCQHCVDLITHSFKLKQIISASFQNAVSDVSETSSLKEGQSFMSIVKTKARLRKSSGRSVKVKRKLADDYSPPNKKSIVTCCICKQRYPMMSKMNDFVCSRCKVKSNSDRTIACVKCKAVVPSSLMKEHLERHAKANLKGRCRLRSLTKQPSKAETDSVSSVRRKNKQKCPRCQKTFNNSQLIEKHLREVHAKILTFVCEVCNRDMRGAHYLEKHMKTHEQVETFECEICGRIFKDKGLLEKHTKVHSSQSKRLR